MVNIPHETDGLMFAPAEALYVCGRDEKLLKWKPPSLNTIDFLLKVNFAFFFFFFLPFTLLLLFDFLSTMNFFFII